MLEKYKIENILFLDIETVPAFESFDKQSERFKKLWTKKAERLRRNEEETPETLYPRAGIYSEFGKIICISAGYMYSEGMQRYFKVKSFYGDDEKVLLTDFLEMLRKFHTNDQKLLCAHNGKEFDFPYIARRSLINGLKLPSIIDSSGKKPWEVKHIDTMELWKFGDYKNYTSLELLAKVFNIPTPKDDINGSQVASVYYEEKNLERIATYCEKDVLTIAQLVLRYKGENLIPDNCIESIS